MYMYTACEFEPMIAAYVCTQPRLTLMGISVSSPKMSCEYTSSTSINPLGFTCTTPMMIYDWQNILCIHAKTSKHCMIFVWMG